ncbi:MAG: LCP family protein [Clostridia bacterium]|nr:LCP family protein [Clostridia bacterium]
MSIKFDKKTITCFALAFVIALVAMTGLRVFIGEKAEETIFEHGGEILNPDEQQSLVDTSSPFYREYTNKNRINFLLMGLADKNTDTIMIASYETEKQTIDIISIPRDTFYARDGYSNYAYNKVNSVYRTENVTGVAKACSDLLYGMPIHYYAIVEYDDIRKVMDVIGGVEVDVPFHMKYDDPTAVPELHIDIKAGKQLITSKNVEQYLRFRHGNPGYKSYFNGDLGRIQAQQEFVKLVLAKCLKASNITEVAKVALQNVQSDITYAAVAQLATKALNGLSVDSVTTNRLPGYDAMLHNLSFWMPDDSKVFEMLQGILNPETEEITSSGAVSAQ